MNTQTAFSDSTSGSAVTASTEIPQRPISGRPITNPGDALVKEAPVVRYLNALLGSAVRLRASDIHIEPQDSSLRVRWRIDGQLTEAEAPPLEMKEALVSRIKVLAKLDISEKRLPQDGHIKQVQTSNGKHVEFRVSTLPTALGEKVVLRVLDHDASSLQIDALGLEPSQLNALNKALRQPHGMILVTGPTGSGKTVTLYSCLNRLNRPEINISTVEDPSEIRLPGITQVNVNEKAGLNFAAAMRSFLRQDPDVIMVGEIRDGETADIAVKAAQTGHLVLSTLHTNDAPSTLSRLVNMGVPAYQVAASVSLICAQRLVRRLCDHCKKPQPITDALRHAIEPPPVQPDQLIYSAVGCPKCIGGYRGRMGIFQVMPITEAMIHAMTQGQSTQAIAEIAKQAQVMTLRQSAMSKVMAGLTSMEEVLTLTRET